MNSSKRSEILPKDEGRLPCDIGLLLFIEFRTRPDLDPERLHTQRIGELHGLTGCLRRLFELLGCGVRGCERVEDGWILSIAEGCSPLGQTNRLVGLAHGRIRGNRSNPGKA